MYNSVGKAYFHQPLDKVRVWLCVCVCVWLLCVCVMFTYGLCLLWRASYPPHTRAVLHPGPE